MMEDNMQNKNENFPDMLDFVGLKKKKKVRFISDENDSFELKKDHKSPLSNRPASDNILATIECNDIDTDLSFDLTKKKKKRKGKASEMQAEDNVEIIPDHTDFVIDSTDRNDEDYTYDELLSRVFTIMREKDPNRDTQSVKKLVMKPPQVIRIGTKKSSFVNFLEVCKLLHRLPQHVQSFLLVELGTSGSIDGNNQLIIKGRFEQRQIENVLRRYIKEYVSCHTCRSPDTMLQKDTRLFFLQCESCGARCSVASIKAGFQAVTSKRAAMRAKAH